MTAAPKKKPLLKLHCRDRVVSRTSSPYGEAVADREETSESTGKSLRGRGPGTYTKIAEIMSGRGQLSAGTDDNLRRPLGIRTTEVGWRHLVWRMSQYER
jgi:hypothetical protein